MTAACTCTAPTGVHGELLTLTRGSSGTCFRHGTLSGIANGDLVTCSSGQARVMPGGDGSGVVGLLNEGSRTNDMLWSNDITNAAWPAEGGGNDCTKTADAAIGPDNTTTADRVQCASTGTGVYQAINQIAVTHNPASVSTFLRGNGTSGTIDVCTSGGAYSCTPCTFVPTSWTRCLRENQNIAGGRIYIGNMTALNGGTARAAADFFIAYSQSEAGAFASSPIATTTAAASRAGEVETLPFVNGPVTGSFAASVVLEANDFGADGDHSVMALSTAGPAYAMLMDGRAATSQLTFYTLSGAVNGGWGFSAAGVEYRTSAFWTGSGAVITVRTPDTSVLTSSGTGGSTTLVELGTYNGVANLYGVIKEVCADSNAPECHQ